MNDHAQTESQRGQRASLLLVDDDRLVLATLSDGLREMGYRVSVAASGREAMEAIGRETFDLVILDVRMPGMDGIEVAARLRETGGPPFIFLSAYGDLDIVRQASENGALGYLLKPIDIPQIVPSIEASLVRAAEIGRLRESESRLGNALVIEQKTRTAVGVLMALPHRPASGLRSAASPRALFAAQDQRVRGRHPQGGRATQQADSAEGPHQSTMTRSACPRRPLPEDR